MTNESSKESWSKRVPEGSIDQAARASREAFELAMGFARESKDWDALPQVVREAWKHVARSAIAVELERLERCGMLKGW